MENSTTDPNTTFGDGLTGEVLRPGDADYDEARRIHNGLIDRRPKLIVRCRMTEDVVTAIRFARARGLEVSVRGGGHGVAGRALADGGLALDMSRMKRIDVDPTARTAVVQPGVNWAELNVATQQHGLATTGGVVSTTGVAGLTLGGGWGWLAGVHGLTIDNLLGAEVVTADGRVLTANVTEHADLFWGLRGGGGSFGVVVDFRFRLHPVGPTIAGGLVAYPLDRATEVLRLHRALTASSPDELSVSAGLISAHDGSRLAAIVGCYAGPLEDGLRALAPVRELGAPVIDAMGPIAYADMCALLDASFPKGALNYWKSRFVDALPDVAIDTLVDRFADCPSPMTAVVLDHWHGAAVRVPVEATAFAHRRPGLSLFLLSQWRDPSASEANIAWTRQTYAAMEPYTRAARYVNFTDADDAGVLGEAHGVHLARLGRLKAQYDPGNLFRPGSTVHPMP